jgi:formylglycine-generating enzyme required for sulfatase activity
MKKTMTFIAAFIALFVLAAELQAQQKFALVIGNGAYTGSGMSRLTNPVNDANDITSVLQSLGFTVEKVLDGNLDQMESSIMRLKNRLSVSKNSYGFFFYAGHGVQSAGVNYLIPVGASIPSENSLRDRAVSVQFMLAELNDAGNELNIVILDACRDNPFSWARSGGSRGLAMVANQPADSIIVYATSAGSTAADGEGRNGLFTGQLLNQLKTPGLDIKEIFDNTGAAVSNASGRKQIPAIYSQYFGKAYLGTRPAVVQPQVVQPSVRPTVPANMVRVEGGTFTMGSPANEPERYDNEGPQHQVTVSGFYMGKYPVTQKEWYEVMGTTVRQQRDMADKSWSIVGEGDNYPMYYVSWNEAVEFCNKLSVKEGLTPAYRGSAGNITCDWNAAGYRLPTEAEWEFAAKGGTKEYITTVYSGSNNADAVAWYTGNSGNSTHPVGTKAANSLELYDMSGNVYEWCWDWYGSYGSDMQTDPRGAASGTDRVARGGGLVNSARNVRSAYRDYGVPSGRSGSVGFRLVRN